LIGSTKDTDPSTVKDAILNGRPVILTDPEGRIYTNFYLVYYD
jgi:hypothetical protein